MFWSLSPYYFCSLTSVFNSKLLRISEYLKSTYDVAPSAFAPPLGRSARRRLKLLYPGAKMLLPYMDDYLFFASTRQQAL